MNINIQLEPDLLAAVDALTKPVILIRWQDVDHDHEWDNVKRPITPDELTEAKRTLRAGDIIPRLVAIPNEYICLWCDETSTNPRVRNTEQTVRRRTEAPLLEQLRDAIASDKGQSGGKKPGREQVPVDIAVIQTYGRIDEQIRSWLLDLGARPGKEITAEQALRTWYTLWAASQHTDGLERRHRLTLEGWANEVRDKLQPPKRIEITAPCPACKVEWLNVGLKLENGKDDPEDLEYVRTLTAVERPSLDESYAICANCDTVWLGVGRMRQLRISIDEAAAEAAEADRVAMLDAYYEDVAIEDREVGA